MQQPAAGTGPVMAGLALEQTDGCALTALDLYTNVVGLLMEAEMLR